MIVFVIALAIDAISFVLVGDQVITLSGWTDMWAYVGYLYLLFPVTAGAYGWISFAAVELFGRLKQSKAVIASDEAYDALIKGHPHSLDAMYNHRGWSIASALIVAAVGVYYGFIFAAGWDRLAFGLRVLKVLVVYVPGWYIVCQIVARQIVTILGLRQVFHRFAVCPHPLHPDRCGGLRAINTYAAGVTYVIAVAGMAVGLMAYVTLRRQGSLSTDTAIWIAVYVVLAVACFFLPPWTAHAAMADAKHKLLDEISRQFQKDYSEATANLASATSELCERVDRIQSLRTLYELTDAFPVWPFDTVTLRRFVVTVTAPLTPVLIELAIGIGSALIRSQ
jgi:hypothetical protein